VSTQEKIQRQREKDPQYQYNLGIFYINNGQPDKALEHLNKSLSLDPDNTLTLIGLGLAHTLKRNLEESERYYKKALSLDPTIAEAHNYLGSVYQEMDYLDKAEQEFLIAAQTENYHSRELPYYNLARLYLIKEEKEKAYEYIKKSIEINNNLAMSLNLYAVICEEFERYTEAIDYYEKALKISPDEINIQFNLAGAYLKKGDYIEAEQVLMEIKPKAQDPEMKENIEKYLKIIEENKKQ
jgi:Tfp pilus assembly protein PilF